MSIGICCVTSAKIFVSTIETEELILDNICEKSHSLGLACSTFNTRYINSVDSVHCIKHLHERPYALSLTPAHFPRVTRIQRLVTQATCAVLPLQIMPNLQNATDSSEQHVSSDS